MAIQIYQAVLATLAVFILHRLYRYSKLSSRAAGFPPGPGTVPFLGNLHQLPISRPELKFATFARQFGSITGIKAGCQNMIILNTWQAVRDLLEQKGSIYSSRPTIPVCEIVVPGGLNPALNPYGDLWRGQRKKLVDFLGGERTDKMKPVQDAESTQMIFDMLKSPVNFEHHVDRSFGAVILATVFGQRGKTFEHGGKIESFFKVEEQWSAAVGPTSSPPINSFPFLNSVPDWLTPWKGWKLRALGIKGEQERLYIGLLNETRERLSHGKGANCFLSQCLVTQEKEWYDDTYLAYLGGVLLEGGAETSSSATMVFIMAMAAFPEVLERAQEEVDRVCGVSRLPGQEDTANLPYIRACMLEVLRWRPVTPLAIPHHTTAQDTYQTYNVPAGTDVVINCWMINHDETFYDSPATFNPSRYILNDFGASAPVDLETNKGRRLNYTFGAGRRVCPGQRFAENSMMMLFAKLVWAFDIEATGKLPLDLQEGWTEGVVIRPKNLPVKFKLRGGDRKKVVHDAWLEADAFLQQFE
ncbi:cytochrome P450 [Ophiobolus disseminans]|uniref:Cytochrome P450 n=1 Tax=Ophiobolus disseminans TaxID=1469910 RepID=A0A6A7ADD1_9PLEO|nr:cytochrome P450 [Ophiobolus disseminans]